MASKTTDTTVSHDPDFVALEPARVAGWSLENVVPLTPLQEAMLFHTLASDSVDVYLVQQRIEIFGPLQVQPFQDAWSYVVERHPALRTVFLWEGRDRPVQAACRGWDVVVEHVDLVDSTEAAETIEKRFAQDRAVGFSLDMPPVMRLVLFRVRPDLHILLWSHHHLLLDGWSAANVLGEVFAAYETLVAGTEPLLDPVRPFSDFVDWLGQQDPAASKSFWREHLARFDQPSLLANRQRELSHEGHQRIVRTLEEPDALRSFARQRGLSLNSVLLGAFAVILGRHLGTSDVAVALVASGRPPGLPGVEAMVGMFINTVALRLEVDGALTAEDWLSLVQRRQAAVLEHEQSSLADIQEASDLGPGVTLTDTLFALWSFSGTGGTPSGEITYRTVDGYGRTSFPVSLTVEAGDHVRVALEFDPGDLPHARAERLLDHYATWLASLVASPTTPVGQVPMLTGAELETLHEYNNTRQQVPYHSVLEAISTQAAAHPNRPALTFGGETMTYRELGHASDAIAAEIIRRGGWNTRRVAIRLPRSPAMIAAMLGVMKAGASYIPIDRHLPAVRVSRLLDIGGADLLITDQTTLEIEASVPTIELPLPDSNPLDVEIPPSPEDIAYVMYTSGSTGTPKGVEVSHGALLNYVWWAWAAYGKERQLTFPLYTSPGFDLTITSIFVPLVSGGTVVIYPDEDPRDLSVLDVFADDAVDVVKLTPSHLALLDEHHFETLRIRALVVGGEDLRADLASRVHRASRGRIAVYNEYGPTEATVGCMIHRFDPDQDARGSVPIGRPIANTRAYLLDHNLAHTPTGTAGRLYVAGAGLAAGYLDDQAQTAEVFLPDPFYPGERMYDTGDLARWRGPGSMEFVGRADDQMKVRGNRIEPGEIEAALMEHDMVAAAAVAVREVAAGDRRLVAYYVPALHGGANVSELREHLVSRLPEYMVVRHLVRVDELPLTPNGKLDRSALPHTLGEVTSSAEPVAPATSAEQLVAGIAGELLGTDAFSITDNFFDLGGHSILAVRLIARLRAETGIRISPRVILLNSLRHAASLLPQGSSTAPTTNPDGDMQTLAKSAAFFGTSREPLFGIYDAPAAEVLGRRAVVLCPPIGWEYMRTHWTLRRIARLLANAGFHVMRFDYFGTGDSSGSQADGSIERWTRDVSQAVAEVKLRSGADGVSVVGVRMGATLGALAAATDSSIGELIMWDPIVRGSDYLVGLETLHQEMLRDRRSRTSPTSGDELLGFPFPPVRRRQFEALDLTTMTWPAIPLALVASQPRPEYTRLADAVGQRLRLDLVPDETAWDDLASSLGSLLPRRIPGHIVTTLAAGDE